MFDLLQTHNQLQQLTFNPLVLISSFVITPINVALVTQQIGSTQAGSNLFSTLSNIQRAEGNEAFVKGFFSQYIVMVLEHRIRRLISSYIEPTRFGKALVPELPVLIGHWLTYPLKLIRTRLIQQPSHVKYHGIFDCFVKMRQEEGALATWRGVALDTVRVAFGLFFNNWAHDAINMKVVKLLPTSMALFCGIPAEILLGFLTFPISTIVTKLQAQVPNAPKRMRPDVQAEGIVECVQKSVQKNGLLGLWNGYFAYCVRNIAQVATVTVLTQAVWRIGFLKRALLATKKA